MTNRYLEKIASWEREEVELALWNSGHYKLAAAELSDLEKQAFFKALSKLFSRTRSVPKPPQPAQPSTGAHDGTVRKLSISKEQMSANSKKFTEAQRTAAKSRTNRLAAGVEKQLAGKSTFQ